MGQTKIHSRQIKQVSTSAEFAALIADGIISATKLLTTATDAELNFLSGVTSNIQTQLNEKLAKSALKTNSTAVWTDDTTAVTALAISNKIASEITSAQVGNAKFMGGWSTAPATPDSGANIIKQGWSYVYDSGTAPTGVTLEVGDYLTAKVDITTAALKSAADSWVVVQTNIDGAVTAAESVLTSGRVLVGAGGRSISMSSFSGLAKFTNGVMAAAVAADLPTHVHNRRFTINGTAANLTTDDTLIFTATGGGSIAYNSATKTVTFTFPTIPSLSGGGTAPAGSYISGISVSGHAITPAYAVLPTIPAAASAVYVTNIVPSGTKNGTNVTFTLADNIVATTLTLYLNGQALVQGTDYTLGGTGNKTITFASDSNIPISTDTLTASYIKA